MATSQLCALSDSKPTRHMDKVKAVLAPDIRELCKNAGSVIRRRGRSSSTNGQSLQRRSLLSRARTGPVSGIASDLADITIKRVRTRR
jgi:hypothetical protein